MKILIEQLRVSRMEAYAKSGSDISEHHGIEQTVLAGGYGYRQVLELVQNGADAILEGHENGLARNNENRIHVSLRDSLLYVANTGAPLSDKGVKALLSSHSSPKRGNQIGRFGLGFKSLLRLGGKIDLFTARSGAIRFDPERCRRELMEQFKVTEAPGLRLAWPLEDEEQRRDPMLREFAWAETVVRAEVRTADLLEHLRQEIRSFPSEFVLFQPLPVVLQLNDGQEPQRIMRVEANGDERILDTGGVNSRWRMVKRDIQITEPRAINDATHIHARDSIPLAWAVPLDGKREESGRFWFAFPTQTPTYLPGILNAPWKLNSDRNAIIGGEWNTALMREAGRLIAETLPKLSTPDDPGRPLDAFPRQHDRKDEAAAPLVEAIWDELQHAAVIPSATGTLRSADELLRHPRDNAGLARQWQELADPESLSRRVHPSCLERQRGSRLNALADRLKPTLNNPASPILYRDDAVSWFAAVASAEAEQAIRVLKLAEAYKQDCKPPEWELIRLRLAIIPVDDGRLLTADKTVFAPNGVTVPDRSVVAQALNNDAEAKRLLTDVMKVKPLDEKVWSSVLLQALDSMRVYRPAEVRDAEWKAFWAKLRSAPANIRLQFVDQYKSRICVLRCDNAWVSSDEVLFPGALVGPHDVRLNMNVLVDPGFHQHDVESLLKLGVVEFPSGRIGPNGYSTVVGNNDGLREWLSKCRNLYRPKLANHHNPKSKLLHPFSLTLPRGWWLLTKLVGVPNSTLTRRFLEDIAECSFDAATEFGHITCPDKYPKIEVPHPLPWLVLKHGTVQVGDETVRLTAVVARRTEPALALIPYWQSLRVGLERLDGTDGASQVTETDIQSLWFALIKQLATVSAIQDDSLTGLWAGAAKDGVVPATLDTVGGSIPLTDVFVTGSPDLARRARRSDRIVVTLGDEALQLWLNRDARNLSELISAEWTLVVGPADLLTSMVPDFSEVLRCDVKNTARCQLVSELRLNIDGQSEKVPCLMWENVLLMDSSQFSQIQLSRSKRFSLLLDEVAAAGWLKCEASEALRILGDSQVDERRAKVACGDSLADRLWIAVGEREQPLRAALGSLADKDFIQQLTSRQLAALTLAQLGPTTLTTLKEALEEEGLKPPPRWNTSEARAFVASIGFPEEFATSPESRREAEEFISGPIELPPLHDFQEEVFKGIRNLIASCTSRRRAVVSLPTGGGKTRVTVEAAVRLVLKPENNRRSVVWVAQTDELCEQAVQAFRQVWLNLGAQRTNLRIVRLWGGNPNPPIQEAGRPIVVVASIQTLNNRMGSGELEWLQHPGIVVVDECHHAITPSYTNLLRACPRFITCLPARDNVK